MMVVRTAAMVVQKHHQRVYGVLTAASNGKPLAREAFRLVATNAIGVIRLIGSGNLRRIKTVNFPGLVLRSRSGTAEYREANDRSGEAGCFAGQTPF